MNNIATFFEEYSFISGIFMILTTVLIILLRNRNKTFFEKEDNHDVLTGEMNASYWSLIIILMMIGLYLISRGFD